MDVKTEKMLAKAGDAARSGHPEQADKLYQECVERCRTFDEEGLALALCAYGRFLLSISRIEEAELALEEAISLDTDSLAIFSEYVRMLTRREDYAGLVAAIRERALKFPGRSELTPHVALIIEAEQARRYQQTAFAEKVMRESVLMARAAGDQHTCWRAIGSLGVLLDQTDRYDEALSLLMEAFEEGSDDVETIERIMIHFQRRKDLPGRIAFAEAALQRRLPAKVEADLRRAIDKDRSKLDPEGVVPGPVQLYSVRHGEGYVALAYQAMLQVTIVSTRHAGDRLYLYGKNRGRACTVEVAAADGREIRRSTDLPIWDAMHFQHEGWGLGSQRVGRVVGACTTTLRFVDPAGTVVGEAGIPDAVSEIATHGHEWYVGCRNGTLYAFDRAGQAHWQWQVPGATRPASSPYMRPCPYYVAADSLGIAVNSLGNVYFLNHEGAEQWRFALPKDSGLEIVEATDASAPLDVAMALDVLGIRPGASSDQIRSAYRQTVKVVHPDHNPSDRLAADKFKRVQAAYELLTCPKAGDVRQFELSLEVQDETPAGTFVYHASTGTVVGSSYGRIHVLDGAGRSCKVYPLGRNGVRGQIDADGQPSVAWCDGLVFVFRNGAVANAFAGGDYGDSYGAWGDDVLVWRQNRLTIYSPAGNTLWAAEFPSRLETVSVDGNTLICAAGNVLYGFIKATPVHGS